MKNKSLYLEAKMLADFLNHPAGFNVDFAGILCIRPCSEEIPIKTWAVEWDSFVSKNQVCTHTKVFNDLHEAAYFFVQKRHELRYGLDFEKEDMEAIK